MVCAPEASGAVATVPREEIIQHLQSVSLFFDIRDNLPALEAMSTEIVARQYLTGEVMIKEGQSGSELFLLISGSASVYKTTPDGDPFKVAVLDGAKNAFFGEGALLDAEARSATIAAESEARCLILNRRHFEHFCKTYPEWALPVLRQIARVVMIRFRKTNAEFMLLYQALLAEVRGGEN
ncbi:MAG: cyclic nucleotide-binding domain-containing protein [Bdellovibrionota bacterium]